MEQRSWLGVPFRLASTPTLVCSTRVVEDLLWPTPMGAHAGYMLPYNANTVIGRIGALTYLVNTSKQNTQNTSYLGGEHHQQ